MLTSFNHTQYLAILKSKKIKHSRGVSLKKFNRVFKTSPIPRNISCLFGRNFFSRKILKRSPIPYHTLYNFTICCVDVKHSCQIDQASNCQILEQKSSKSSRLIDKLKVRKGN